MQMLRKYWKWLNREDIMRKEIQDYLNLKKKEAFNICDEDISTLSGQLCRKKYVSSQLICRGENVDDGVKREIILDGDEILHAGDVIKIKDADGRDINITIKNIRRKEDEKELEENAYHLKSEYDNNVSQVGIDAPYHRHYIMESMELSDEEFDKVFNTYKDIAELKNYHKIEVMADNIRTMKNITVIMFTLFCIGIFISLLVRCTYM